jgi:hypothetical protein
MMVLRDRKVHKVYRAVLVFKALVVQLVHRALVVLTELTERKESKVMLVHKALLVLMEPTVHKALVDHRALKEL